MKTLSVLKGQHQRGVCAVDFSGMYFLLIFTLNLQIHKCPWYFDGLSDNDFFTETK